jgi:hypothetical protein
LCRLAPPLHVSSRFPSPDSSDVVDEIILDYYFTTLADLDLSLHISFFEVSLPYFARRVLPMGGRVIVPATDQILDKIYLCADWHHIETSFP